MAQERLVDEIERLASPYLKACGLTLVDSQLKRRGHRIALLFYVDKPGGIGIEDCTRLSLMMGDALDVAGLIDESYDLEVSSPGLDRELRKDREFEWALGKLVRCWTSAPLEGTRECRGRLRTADQESLTIEEASGRLREISRHLITKVRLEFEFPRRSKDRPALAPR